MSKQQKLIKKYVAGYRRKPESLSEIFFLEKMASEVYQESNLVWKEKNQHGKKETNKLSKFYETI